MPRVANNPYEVLGVPHDADATTIKAAYRQMALRFHPDRNPGNHEAEERFKEISEAYAVLRDPDARARFDRYGSTGETAYRPDFSTMDWQTIFREADIPIDWDARGGGTPRSGNAVFDALFGMMTGLFRNAGLLPGETREMRLRIPYKLARAGGTRRVRVPGTSVCPTCGGQRLVDGEACPDCGGSGVRHGGAEVDVALPRGIHSGTRMRLKGLGGPGNPPGDLFVRVEVALPGNARLDGDDLVAEVYLTPLEASRGAITEFEGVRVRVPAGTPEGATVRVAGGGLGSGDLLATIRYDVWRGLLRGAGDWYRRLTEGASGS